MHEKKNTNRIGSSVHSSDSTVNDFDEIIRKVTSLDERRQKLLEQLDRLEDMKQQVLKSGHKDVAESFSAQQREIRRALEELGEDE